MPARPCVAAATRRTFVTPQGRPLAFTRLGLRRRAARQHAPHSDGGREPTRRSTAAWDAGLRYFDTAPLYGHGLSESADRPGARRAAARRLPRLDQGRPAARALRAGRGGAAASIKDMPPLQVRFDYSRDGVLRSFEASLARLGLDRVDILYVHDLEPRTHGSDAAYEARWRELTDGGGWRALDELRAAGVVAAIGARRQRDGALRAVAGRARSRPLPARGPLHPAGAGAAARAYCRLASARGVGVVIGGPFNSGVLARPGGTYNYAAAPTEVLARVERLAAVCARFGVPLAAAALQFAAAHPAVVSVIPGAQTPAEVEANVAHDGRGDPAGALGGAEGRGARRSGRADAAPARRPRHAEGHRSAARARSCWRRCAPWATPTRSPSSTPTSPPPPTPDG